MAAGIIINSELVEGAILHPTLPMSYIGETVKLNGENYTASYEISFQTINSYTDPFFILDTTGASYFYYHVEGSGRNFKITFERSYSITEGRYIFYINERAVNEITRPMFTTGTLYVGGSRG